VGATAGALEKTLFEFAAQDWRTKQPIPAPTIGTRMRAVQAGGARHIGYYPDDFVNDHPALEAIRPYISAADYPYAEPAR
jgi:biofilm PGA synthesis lipoprotein PgaB